MMTSTRSNTDFAVAICKSRSKRLLAITLLSFLIALAMMFALQNQAAAQEAGEYEVKAAFIYNFAKFIEWPSNASPSPSEPMVIGILGRDPFGGEIDRAVAGKTVNGRRLVIKRFPALESYEYCHILFVSSSERNNLSRILATVANSGVLTVSETERFAQIGGIINFTTVENRIRFEINQAAAERAGLKISSKLLSLGRAIRT
jgi:hypothetical protein